MTKYCICRSKDGSGFMLGCDNCAEWFHGKCINVKKKESENIDKWYCPKCKKGNPNLKTVYKNGMASPPPLPEKKIAKIKQEPLEERKQEKRALEKDEPTTALVNFAPPKAKPEVTIQQQKPRGKQNNVRKGRAGQKAKARIQCGHPECIYEARPESKYCSDECGLAYNKFIYERHFIPKWKILGKDFSEKGKAIRLQKYNALETEIKDTELLIKNLRSEKDELERNIKIIKEQATKLASENANTKENDDSDAEMDNPEVEEIISGDVSRTYCVTCGHTIPAETAFKHWASCHKKKEEPYAFTSNQMIHLTPCEGDSDPKLYCHQPSVGDKKSKRYCMNIESACPQHSNWQSNKDEICGCPLNIMQKIVPDGNYCLELKKDCSLHYQWDKFRIAQIDMQRLQAFNKLDFTKDNLQRLKYSSNDIYGGVLGVMLHNTINHKPEKNNLDDMSPHDEEEEEEINVDIHSIKIE